MTTTTEQLKELLAKVTPGQWDCRQNKDDEDAPFSHPCHLYSETYGAVGYWTGHKQNHRDERWYLTEPDATLIALAPTLAAEVVRLREALGMVLNVDPDGAGIWDAQEHARQDLDATSDV